jgi:hypothetical protein
MTDVLVHSDSSYCPNAYRMFTRDSHGAQYVCGAGHTYRDATYVWDTPLPPVPDIVLALRASAPLTLAFIGDSTVQQVFYAVACELDRAGALDATRWTANGTKYARTETIDQPDGISLTFAFSRFLRADVPCAPWCTNSSDETCSACDTTGRSRVSALDDPFQNVADAQPEALFIGVGSWYNYHKGLYDSDAAYQRTLHLLERAINTGVRRTQIFWYDIPNCGAACDRARRPEPAYEWGGIAAKNEMARRTLGDAVHFLNVSGAVQHRLQVDRVWPDGGPTDGMPHYCNPGPSSIPQFIAHVVLSMLQRCLISLPQGATSARLSSVHSP